MNPLRLIDGVAAEPSRGTKRALEAEDGFHGKRHSQRPENVLLQTRSAPPERPAASSVPSPAASSVPTRARSVSTSPLSAALADPYVSLPIFLSGSGIAAGLPGCATTRSPSTLRSWPVAKIVHDAHARSKLKAIWLVANLRRAPRSQQAQPECAAVVRLLTREMLQKRAAPPAPPEAAAALPRCLAAGLGSGAASFAAAASRAAEMVRA